MGDSPELIPAIQTRNLTKTFGEVVANEKVSFDVRRGEILALLRDSADIKKAARRFVLGLPFWLS